MELATQAQLEILANALEQGNPKRPGRPRKGLPCRTNLKPQTRNLTASSPVPEAKSHCCKCGMCRVCLQNAEWDAKFNQRFGESMKDYYSGMRLTRQASWWSEL